ncbi:MAG TPA: hypothetical protein EYP56_03030 [Planctomycetaceae bacterium]|nr:hypothetical protein [Planctomycetaceae bacterium]
MASSAACGLAAVGGPIDCGAVLFAANGQLATGPALLVAQGNLSTALTLGMLLVVVLWLLFRSHRYYRRLQRQRARSTEPSAGENAQRGHHLEAPGELVQWEVEMHELARRLCGELESKMGVLMQLVREADRAAARLEAAVQRARTAEASGRATAGGSSPTPSAPKGPATQAESLKGRALRHVDTSTAVEGPHVRRSRDEVYVLADYGYEPDQIARRVGIPVGEVQLILGLRQKA